MPKPIVIAGVVILAVSGAALAVGFLSPWTGDETGSVEARPQRFSVEAARQFKEFPVYWVGEEFQGMPLAAVQRVDWPGAFPGKPYNDPIHEVAFIYGDCEIPAGEERCPVPLTISVGPGDELPYDAVMGKQGPPECVRGALVQRLKSGALEIWTGDAQVSLVPAGDVNLEPAVSSLMRANGDKPDVPGQPFPPPKGGECN